MNKDRIFLSSPHMGGNEKKYIDEAFEQNFIAPLGPNVTYFEEDLQRYLGKDVKVAALSSGTAALHLALIHCGVKSGDEVLCQSLTFAASANPIVYQGATPVFVDSEAQTLNICPEALETAIKERIKKGKTPKVIIAVHLYGMPYKVEEVHAVAEKYGIPIIEDSAEALGSSYKGQKCGTFGDLSILSFNGNKIITTSGGGALVTKDSKIREQAIFLATQARDQAPHYQHSEIGYNYRLSNISAGIGRGQMEVLDDHIEKRRAVNRFYRQIFEGSEVITVFSETNKSTCFSNFWLSTIFLKTNREDVNPEKLRLHLEQHNIESRPIWKPMHLQPVFKDAPYYGRGTAERFFNEGLCLPSGSNLKEEEKERIKAAISELI